MTPGFSAAQPEVSANKTLKAKILLPACGNEGACNASTWWPRLSLMFNWLHFTRTLPVVEPITSAISEADFPWPANPQIVLMALGVNTRRRPPRGNPTLTSPDASTLLFVGSIQCTSSKIISTGLACASASSCAVSASNVFCRRCCGSAESPSQHKTAWGFSFGCELLAMLGPRPYGPIKQIWWLAKPDST